MKERCLCRPFCAAKRLTSQDAQSRKLHFGGFSFFSFIKNLFTIEGKVLSIMILLTAGFSYFYFSFWLVNNYSSSQERHITLLDFRNLKLEELDSGTV